MFTVMEENDMDEDRCYSRVIHSEKIKVAKENALGESEVNRLSRTFKMFADPSRIRILTILGEQEMCVCDLAHMLDVSESAVSHQLRLLRTMDLVKNRREGTILYYCLNDDHIKKLLDVALEHVRE